MTIADSHHLALTMADRGQTIVTFDHLGFGDSSIPNHSCIFIEFRALPVYFKLLTDGLG